MLVVLAALLVPACGPSAGPDAPSPAAARLAPRPDAEGRRWVEETLEEMELREQVAQLVVPWMSGAYASTTSTPFDELAELVELGVGGFVVSIGLPHSYAAKLNELQRRARVPLLVTSDFESGGPGMRIRHVYALPSLLPQGGGTSFPPTMAFGAIGDEELAYEYGRITAVEARAVGVHLNFAPVLDVNSNPRNPVINTRSFGEDPEEAARLGSAFVRGSRDGGALSTAKHFPGHGDTDVDSHIALPVVRADRIRLDSLELVPFRRAIDEGVDGVMTAHVAVPRILGEGGPPATMSRYFLDVLLREEMGFEGLVLTDALSMGAITGTYGSEEAAVLALEAGNDVLLDPADPAATVDAVVAAVESGRLSRERIRRSARRVLTLKARVGLHERREVDLEAVDDIVGSGPHLAAADTAAARSITLPRDRDGLVPLRPDSVRRVLGVTWTRPDDATGSRTADAMLERRFENVRTVTLDDERPVSDFEELWNPAWRADRVLVNVLVGYRMGTGTIGVPDHFSRFVRKLAIHRPLVLSSFGNPYLLSAFPEVGSYLLAWGAREVSQEAAVRALAGEASIRGSLPISLPPYHERGEGLRRSAVDGVDVASPGAASGEAGENGEEDASRGGGPGGAADSLPGLVVSEAEAPAGAAGMSPETLARLDTALLEAIADSATPGAALAVGRRGRLVRLRGYGRTDWSGSAPPATPTTVYDLASLTKVVGTTTAVMQLVDRGEISLDDRVVEHLPWWGAGDPRKEEVTLRQLLLHRAGLPPYERFFLDIEGRAAYERAIGALPLESDPGSGTEYSDIGLITLGWVVEEVTGRPLDRYLEEEVWERLGMDDTGFLPDPALRSRIAPTEVDTLYRDRHLRGEVHDENAHAMGGVAGHAGLFSTAADLAVFAGALLEGGELEPCDGPPPPAISCLVPWAPGQRLVSRAVLRRFTRRAGASSTRALGWDTTSETTRTETGFTPAAFGHTGFTGTSIWVDPELDLFVVLLTNRVNPTRENRKHLELRRRVHDLATRAILDR